MESYDDFAKNGSECRLLWIRRIKVADLFAKNSLQTRFKTGNLDYQCVEKVHNGYPTNEHVNTNVEDLLVRTISRRIN